MGVMMQRNTLKTFNQTGRSMLELLAVMAIICLFTISTIIVYNETNDKQKAQTDYEEIRLAALSKLTQGTARTNKGIVDIQSDNKKTRRGTQIMTENNCPQNAVTVTVDKVSPAVCRELLKKNWDSPLKASSFYRAAEFGAICSGDPAQITREGYYIRSEEDCNKTRSNGDWDTFSASFPMNAQMAKVRLCSSGTDCYGCETCTDGNFCKSTCSTGQYCGADGSCHEYEACPEGKYRDVLGNCHKCPDHAVCQDGITVAGCEEGYYLDGIECPKCPDSEEGCTLEDEQDERGCFTKKKKICSGETPLCQTNESSEDFNTCYCPDHATCTESNSGSDVGNQSASFTCEDGYYKSGNDCVKCTNANATKCSDSETATACEADYYLRAGQCLECPENATCTGDADDFVCDEGFEQNEDKDACVTTAPTCSGGAGIGEEYTGADAGLASDGVTQCKCTANHFYNGTECVECRTTNSSDTSCTSNDGLCVGYYCEVPMENCQAATGQIRALPATIPEVSAKTKIYYTSPSVMSWFSAYNYCDAVSKKISSSSGLLKCSYGNCPNLPQSGFPTGYLGPFFWINLIDYSLPGIFYEECAVPVANSSLGTLIIVDDGDQLAAMCDTNISTICSGHGTLNESDACQCNAAYTGDFCQNKVSCSHGTWTEDGCVCNEGYHGATCDTYCNGFLDQTGSCIPCSDRAQYMTTTQECNLCKGERFIEETSEGRGWCLVTNCGENFFHALQQQTSNGSYTVCLPCSTERAVEYWWDTPSSTVERMCSECNNTSSPRSVAQNVCALNCNEGEFLGTSGRCYSCSEELIGVITDDKQCQKCNGLREMRPLSGGSTGNVCTLVNCPEGYFHDGDSHTCYSCENSFGRHTNPDECALCGSTRTYDSATSMCNKA